MLYKISFTDQNGEEFLGTTEHFVTDGRYSVNTIIEVARDIASKSLKKDYIKGFNIRRNSFNAPVISNFKFDEV